MSNTHASTTFPSRSGADLLSAFLAQASAVLSALLQPRALLREVDGMARLLAEARRIESRDPARAAQLRRQALRACR